MSTQDSTDTQAFFDFLAVQINSDAKHKSPEELLQEWRAERREFEETVADIELAIPDMEAGRGIPLEQVVREIRDEFGFSKPE